MYYAPGKFDMYDDNGEEYRLTVEYDEFSDNPRDNPNFSTIYCWHRSYQIGDEKPREKSAWDILAELCEKHTKLTEPELENLSERQMVTELQAADDIVIQYISCYEHSGITISTAIDTYPYNDHWDSSIIGFAYVEKASKVYMIGSWKAEALAAIQEEVAMLDKFLQGEVYTATLEKKTHIYKEEKCPHCGEVISTSEWDDWEEVESASGFYGYDLEENGILHDFCNGLHFKEEVRPAKMA